MTTRLRNHYTKPLAFTLAALMLTGCISTQAGTDGRYASPIGDAPVTSNQTPYSRALQCIRSHEGRHNALRIAVGQIADYTGKYEADGGGRKITQGAALMAISALAKAGVPLVERYDTSVAELELKYANNKLIGDANPDAGYRKIFAGSIEGSDYYLVGGITELNYNIRSTGDDAYWAKTDAKIAANADAKTYVMNIGLDLRLVNTKTLADVDVISYQKQIVGRELQAGVFDILGTHILDIGAGDSALEPIQLAVRAVIERAVLSMVSHLYDLEPGVCRSASDPLAGPDDQMSLAYSRSTEAEPPTTIQSQTSTPPNRGEENNNEQPYQNPDRGNGADDAASIASLRGGLE